MNDHVLTPLITGLVMSGAYILVAAGFALVYGVFKVLNFAHGDVYMIGGFLVFTMTQSWGVSYPLSALASIVACGLLGVIIERGIFRPLWGKPAFAVAMASMGLSMAMQDGAKAIWSARAVMFQTQFSRVYVQIGDVRLSWQRVIIVMFSALFMAGLIYLIQKTNFGKAIRAVAMDRQAAGWVGINTKWIAMMTFAVGAALAGAAAPLLVPILTLDPFVGGTFLMKAFVIVVLGGFSMPGVIVGGVFVGVVQSFTATYVPNGLVFMDSITFAIMILLLIFRPSGLVRERIEENV